MRTARALDRSTCTQQPVEIGRRNDDPLAERLFLARLRRKLLANATGNVLDVGCGEGVNFRHFPTNNRITAIDTNPASVSRANRRAMILNQDITVRTMDAQRIGFADGHFDTVVSSLALCFYRDPIAALNEMSRVCTPDGVILLLEHGRSSFGPWAWWQDRQERLRGPHDGCHQNREPLQLAEQAGLQPFRARRTFFGIIHQIEARPAR